MFNHPFRLFREQIELSCDRLLRDCKGNRSAWMGVAYRSNKYEYQDKNVCDAR